MRFGLTKMCFSLKTIKILTAISFKLIEISVSHFNDRKHDDREYRVKFFKTYRQHPQSGMSTPILTQVCHDKVITNGEQE